MEDIIVNIDSRYRDRTIYSNPSKFKMNFLSPYKNIISIKITSVEINNSVSYIDCSKNNNFLTLYFPNKLNDDTGIQFNLPNGLYQVITSVTNVLNILFENNINSSDKLINLNAEKYFYIFYLNSDLLIYFDFNDYLDESINDLLVIKEGWTSVYGIVLQISNYITNKYNEYINYFNNQENLIQQPLYNGLFNIKNDITLHVFDTRYDNNDRSDKIIASTFTSNSELSNNLSDLKDYIYSSYVSGYISGVNDINNFSTSISGNGILDNVCSTFSSLYSNVFENYTIKPNNSFDNYKYFLNNNSEPNKNELLQLYNIQAEIDSLRTIIQIKNDFSLYTFYCYYIENNIMKRGLLTDFLTDANSLYKFFPDFEIKFNTFDNIKNSYVNGDFDIKKLNYETLGYYLGYRNNFYSPITYNNTKVIEAEKFFNNAGEEYIFMKLNDWGYIDFFGEKMFAKFIMLPALGNPYLEDNLICKEYRFLQPVNISKLNIEIVDYLGNIVDFNGSDYSFTIEMKQIIHSDLKIYFDNKMLTN